VTFELRPASGGRPALEIHRSPRRRRTVSADVADGRVVVRLPAGLPPAEEERLIARLLPRVTGAARARRRGGDAALEGRAHRLADRYLDGVRPHSVRWSTRMTRLYGSCTAATGAIRISARLAALPDYVLDYVIVHELAHLRVRAHDRAFHHLVDRYEHTERARGFLEGYRLGQLSADDDQPLSAEEGGASESSDGSSDPAD
jgi:predicted metal-dependent hydrolase